MGRVPIPMTGPSYSGPSTSINAQELVNMFISVDRQGGKSVLSLLGRYGLDLFADISASPVRGGIAVDPYGYVVLGNVLYKVSNNGESTVLGELQTSSGRVGAARNETQIMITDGVAGYILTLADDTFTTISDGGFSGANDVVFIDHYFAVDNLTGGTAQVSSLENGSSWSALNKATPEADPDGLTRCMAIHSLLWMLGESTAEPWYNANLPYGFPFLRQSGGVVDMGIAARWSAVNADNTLYWLGQNKSGMFGIIRLNGYTPEKISTPALDAELQTYNTVLDCIAWEFTDRGHTFVNFVFPSANKSWCYDPSTGFWHETRSWGVGAFRIGFHMFLNGRHVLGDRLTGKLYTVNWDTYTDNGDTIEAIRTCQHISKNGDQVEITELEIDMEVGLGKNPATYDADGNEEPPYVMLSHSKDHGKTWSGEVFRSMGTTGEYRKKIVKTRLGTASVWTLRIRITDACKRVVKGASALIGVE